jgi:prolyl oligopeptidase
VDVRDQLQIHSTVDEHHITTLNTKLATVYDAASSLDTNDLFLLEFSFCYPPTLWHVDTSEIVESANEQIQRLQLFSDSMNHQTPLITQQVFYSSTDGTKIPMFITSEEGRSIGPDTPVLLYVYGGFGISVVPHFRPDILPFIRAFHGIFAVANIRGGGEYGLGWYTAACKQNRQRLFDDIKTGVRHLKESLGSSKVILMGESIGGLNCATAIVQDPSLVNAAILNAGAFDVLRLRKSMVDDRGKGDVGDPDIPAEFDFIYQWAPLEHMEEAIYPAVLMVTGDKDDVVTFANSGKMAATLQHSTGGLPEAKSVHLRTYSNLGHGGNMSMLEKAKMWVERWLWIHKTLGLNV